MPAAPSGTKWEDFCNHYSIDPAEKDVLEFLRRVHPCEGTNELIILGLAFGMVKKGQSIRIPFVPIAPQGEPDAPTSWLRAVPPEWGTEEGVNFFHRTKLFYLPSIMQYGLKCGPRDKKAPLHRQDSQGSPCWRS